MPLLVVQLPQGTAYSSEDISSRLHSAVKRCSSVNILQQSGFVKGLALIRPTRLHYPARLRAPVKTWDRTFAKDSFE